VSHFTDAGYFPAAKSFETDYALFSPARRATQAGEENIQTLRLQLKRLNAWPEAGDTFLEMLEQAHDYGSTLMPTDFDWLPRVAVDASQGEDIGFRYPSIFQKLLTFPELRQKFLQTLQLHTANT